MSRLLRTVGFGLIVAGIVLLLVWIIAPLRMIWPWIRGLSWPIRVGVLVSALGLAILLGSLISERFREREADRKLLDDF